MAMLDMSNLSKFYRGPEGKIAALEGVALAVEAGEFTAVQGPSGSGKTTLLLAAGGLLVPEEGKVLIDGQDPYAMSHEERARFRAATIGFVFQQYHLIPYLTVAENVLAPSLARRGGLAMRSAGARERATELITRFNMTDRARHVPAELSTGERQRTALARALLNRPKLLLADEPTGNLDEENSEIVLDYLAEFAGEGGAVLLVTHERSAAERAGRRVRLEAGRIGCP